MCASACLWNVSRRSAAREIKSAHLSESQTQNNILLPATIISSWYRRHRHTIAQIALFLHYKVTVPSVVVDFHLFFFYFSLFSNFIDSLTHSHTTSSSGGGSILLRHDENTNLFFSCFICACLAILPRAPLNTHTHLLFCGVPTSKSSSFSFDVCVYLRTVIDCDWSTTNVFFFCYYLIFFIDVSVTSDLFLC